MKQDRKGRFVSEPAAVRFWRRVTPGKPDECWEWRGSLQPNGYGSFSIGRKSRSAHRFSYELHKGPIPEGLLVCHTCDNRRCVNPSHLFAGTYADNSADARRKGRTASGERSPARLHPERVARGSRGGNSKLTEEDIPAIRALRAEGVPFAEIGTLFGVSHMTIRRIIGGKSWTHVPDDGRAIQTLKKVLL